MAFLLAQQLSITLGEKQLFEKLNVDFKPGEVWGVFGHNGAGKTTLLHTLAGLFHPTEGDVFLDEQLVQSIKPKKRAQKIGLLFQDAVFPFPISVLEAVLVGRHPYSMHWFKNSETDIQIARKALKKTQLENLENRFVSTLSGGEKQRLAFATLLAQDPDIYLLDEPTNHLDIEQKVSVLNQLKALAKVENKTIIMVSHDISMMKYYCNHLIVLKKTKEHLVGKASELLTKEKLQTIFSENIGHLVF